MDAKICYELLEIIDNQEKIISNQNKIIVRLVNENAEQENMINVLMNEATY